MTKTLGIFACLCFVSLWVSAQSFTAINYSVSEGLPSKEVYEVFQDRNGFLWFGTDNGIVRYDGYEMKKFGTEQGLSDPVVFGFFEDHKGRIWFRTFSGRLAYYENGKITRYQYNDIIAREMASGHVSSIYIDTADVVWFSSYKRRGYLNSIDPNGKHVIHGDSIRQYDIYVIEKNNKLLYGNISEDVYNILINDKVLPVNPTEFCGKFPRILSTRWKNKLYVSICCDVFEYHNNTLRKVFTSRDPIISLFVDRQDNLWVGYKFKGVDKFSTDEFKPQDVPDFLKKFSVSSALSDSEGGLWFTTLEAGVFYVPNINIINYQPFGPDNIQHVANNTKEILFSTNTGSIYRIDSVHRGTLAKKFDEAIIGLHFTKDNHVWISDRFSSYRFTRDLKQKVQKEDAVIFKMAEDSRGNLWIVSGGQTVYKLNAHSRVGKALGFACRNVKAVDSVVYISSRSGVFQVNNQWQVKEMKELSDFKISDILKLSDSTLLITTIGRGFLVYNSDRHSYRIFNSSNHFLANNIYDVIHEVDNFWFATEKGVLKVSLSGLLAEKPYISHLSKQSGLIGNEIYNLVGLNGNIFAFSDKGFSIIPRENARFSNKSPRFHLKDVFINDRAVRIFNELELSAEENNLRVEFGFISFNNQNILTRYRLNSDENWMYSTQRAMQFYALAPGQYKFELEYSIDNINWLPAYTIPSLVILPPLWKRWYFQLGVGFFLLLLIFLYFRSQLMIYRRHQQKLIEAEIRTLENERSRIAKDLHDSVGTDFTAIKMMVNQELVKYDAEKTKTIEGQFQNTIQEIKNIIYNLYPPGLERYGLISAVHNYVDRLKCSLPIEIHLDSFGPEIKDLNISITVFRVLQELITNSVKHSHARKISLHINSFEDMLSIVYEDNGKGFTADNGNSGFGLYNIESRVRSVQGKMKFETGSFGVSYSIDIPLKTFHNER
jgi:signal transduction histidine kinase/ligand-binding sensor domain-containing protein